MLLNGALRNDARVLNVIRSLSSAFTVHLYYSDGHDSDKRLVPPGVMLFDCGKPSSLRGKVLRHSLIHLEYAYLYDCVVRGGHSYDVVHANDLPTLHPARRLAERFQAKLVYDAHEIYVETLNQQLPREARGLHGLAFRSLLSLMKAAGWRAEARSMRRVDVLLTVSEACARFFVSRYGIAESAVVMNCPALGEYPRSNRIRSRLSLEPGVQIVLYQGVLNEGRGLVPLVESAALLDPPAVLVLVGGGPLLPHLNELAARPHLRGRVLFVPTVPYEELLSHTASADVGVLLLEPINLSKAFALANKVFEYMAASLPIVLSRSVEHDRLLLEVGCGTATPDLTPNEIARTINGVLRDPNVRQMGCLGRMAFERRYNWEAQGMILLEVYGALLAEGP